MAATGGNALNEPNFNGTMRIAEPQGLIQVRANSGALSGLDNATAQLEERRFIRKTKTVSLAGEICPARLAHGLRPKVGRSPRFTARSKIRMHDSDGASEPASNGGQPTRSVHKEIHHQDAKGAKNRDLVLSIVSRFGGRGRGSAWWEPRGSRCVDIQRAELRGSVIAQLDPVHCAGRSGL